MPARATPLAARVAPVFHERQSTQECSSRTAAIPQPAPDPGGHKPHGPCTTDAHIAAGPRVQFTGDPLTLQYYPGEGLRLQPLANFGKANALYNACKGINTAPGTPCEPDQLRALLDRLVAMGAMRHGFLAWEYYFPIYGGRPPWVSGIAEGAALSALAHGAQLFQELQEQQEHQGSGQPPPQLTRGTIPPPPPPPANASQDQTPPPNPPSF